MSAHFDPRWRKPRRRRRRGGRRRGVRRAGRLRVVALAALLVGTLAAGIWLGAHARGEGLPQVAAAPELPWLARALRGPRFRLRLVDVIGLHRVEAAALVAELPLDFGEPLVDVDVGALEAAAVRHRRIAGCRAVRLPPNRLLIDVQEREAVARLAGTRLGIDRDGERFPLALDEARELPEARGDPAAWLPLLLAARARGVAIANVAARAPGDVRFRPAGRDVEVRIGRDPEGALDAWDELQGTGLVRRYGAREVDLRFGNGAVLRAMDTTDRGGTDVQE